ncbi:MAG: [Fe-Fe] hydrogenase large subunit C-terminal domain-containing protein [Oscillospiraceae bacterium]
MDIIQFKEANCKGCYKCIRNCDIKAIKFSNEQARILDSECIYCGKCTLVCPQNAKVIKQDLPETKAFLAEGKKLYASVAPSFVAAFPNVSFSQFSKALKKLGFSLVEETAIGASMVSAEYTKLMQAQEMSNIITTCCPTINLLVEKYYPELVRYLAPVIAPASAHAKTLKEIYGDEIKVVFIGPCISKKYEAQMTNYIDTVLMFDELVEWLNEKNVYFDEDDNDLSEIHNTISRFYPVPRGIIHTIPEDIRSNYKTIAIDGLDRCIDVLNSMKSGKIDGYFIEMNSCVGSCVAGPGMHNENIPFLSARDIILDGINKQTFSPIPKTEKARTDLSKSFTLTLVKDKVPDESTISSILASIGKTSQAQMLNCGACGYSTCRDKAIAVFQGKADLKMCLPYMREKAESMSNIILDNTPDAIFVTDKEFNVLEFNRAAKNMFKQIDGNTVGLPIEMLINSEDFENIKSNGENIYYAICHDTTNELVLNISIVCAPNSDFIIIAKDVSAEHLQNLEMEKIRKDTLETTQKVIDKQMRVAQEIASLLGETTGETKAALTNLKKSIAQNQNL